jgi:hypothetical protein
MNHRRVGHPPDGHQFVNEAFQDWDFDTRQVGYAKRDAAYGALQLTDILAGSAMATEQGNVSLTANYSSKQTEPQFQYSINAWIYRMDQKIDQRLERWYKALENVLSLATPDCGPNCSIGIVFPVGSIGAFEGMGT